MSKTDRIDKKEIIKEFDRFISEGPKFGAEGMKHRTLTVDQVEKEFERQARIWLEWRLKPLVNELSKY